MWPFSYSKPKEVEVIKEVVVEVKSEKIEYIIGDVTDVEVYVACTEEFIHSYLCYSVEETNLGYYTSCSAAFKAHPEAKVKKLQAYMVDGIYYLRPELCTKIEVVQ